MNKNIRKEMIFIIVLLILNLNSITSIISIIILFLYGKRNIQASIKAMMYSLLLSQLNYSIFNSNISTLRTILNIYLMLKILITKDSFKYLRSSKIILVLMIYFVYILFTSILVSWMPLVSIFKGLYFVIGLSSILIGIEMTSQYNWNKWIQNYAINIVSINTVFMLIPQSYLYNNAFKGIFANPNALGIITILLASVLLYSYTIDKYRYNTLFLILAIIQIFTSASRTSIITLIILISYFIVINFVRIFELKGKKLLLHISMINIIAFFSIIIFNFYSHNIGEFMEQKLMKGNADNILYSREGQIDTFENDFNSNKLIGVGFGVDNSNNRLRVFELKLSYPVERGNIILAVLAETGILGMFIFSLLIISLLYECKARCSILRFIYKGILIGASFLTSFGEMTFFSGNSIGVLQWLIIAIYVYQNKVEIKENKCE